MDLEFSEVSKEYGHADREGKLSVLDRISFSAEGSEFVCLLGPSGCGKSTLLKMAAGLEQATSGSVSLDQEKITAPRSGCSMVLDRRAHV